MLVSATRRYATQAIIILTVRPKRHMPTNIEYGETHAKHRWRYDLLSAVDRLRRCCLAGVIGQTDGAFEILLCQFTATWIWYFIHLLMHRHHSCSSRSAYGDAFWVTYLTVPPSIRLTYLNKLFVWPFTHSHHLHLVWIASSLFRSIFVFANQKKTE